MPFTHEWLQSSHSTIKAYCQSAAEIVLLAGSPISAEDLRSAIRVTVGFLVTSLTKALLARLLSLARQPTLGSPGVHFPKPSWSNYGWNLRSAQLSLQPELDNDDFGKRIPGRSKQFHNH